MEIKELRKLIKDKIGEDQFAEWLDGEFWGHGENKPAVRAAQLLGVEFEWLGTQRTGGDFDGYAWRFKADGKCYELSGYYSSYEGSHRDGGPLDFYEVEPVEKTIIVYKKVN